jgi:hypothetical protein
MASKVALYYTYGTELYYCTGIYIVMNSRMYKKGLRKPRMKKTNEDFRSFACQPSTFSWTLWQSHDELLPIYKIELP